MSLILGVLPRTPKISPAFGPFISPKTLKISFLSPYPVNFIHHPKAVRANLFFDHQCLCNFVLNVNLPIELPSLCPLMWLYQELQPFSGCHLIFLCYNGCMSNLNDLPEDLKKYWLKHGGLPPTKIIYATESPTLRERNIEWMEIWDYGPNWETDPDVVEKLKRTITIHEHLIDGTVNSIHALITPSTVSTTSPASASIV